jgi:hypothetical protein
MPYTSTGRTTIVIPVPANEIVRADQNTTNARFLQSFISDLRDGLRASRDKDHYGR